MSTHNSKHNQLIHRLADIVDRYQQVGQDYFKELHDYGTGEMYTSSEVHMITRIEETPGITATKIAEATCRTKSAVSQMLSKLEAKGLIYRERDPGNGKQQLLYVTPKGKNLSLCHKAYDEASTLLEELIDTFGEEAVESYADIMEYLIRFQLRKKDN